MSENNGSSFGAFLGAFVIAAIVGFFVFGGGIIGGKKVVQGDQDLPPVETNGRAN